MFQVVVEVCGAATVVFVMVVIPFSAGGSKIIHRYNVYRYRYISMTTIITGIQIFMAEQRKAPEAIHAWLIMLKAWQSIGRYLRPTMSEDGLGESDFRVLEVLLHKGPMPVNAIGPKVDLNPGSVSVAVDRLYKKGLVSRIESRSDRRVRTVSLTEKGRQVFLPLFRRHAALIKRVFQEVSSGELRQLELLLKRIGKRAQSLAEKEEHSEV
jgi:MarR family transcriptional regulator, 2-MHQ and catechol-resistance regulon repressor